MKQTMQSSLLFFAFLIAFSSPSSILCRSELQTYIVHVRRNANAINSNDLERWYRSFLPPANAESQDSDRLVYSYNHVFNGFAARLTEEELKEMKKKEGFVRAYPNKIIPLLTTHTPDFLGLTAPGGVWKSSNLGRNVIVGVLDTGILAGHPSFSDDGVPPVPSRWKGTCEVEDFCNNKVIGARGFNSSGDGGKKSKSSPKDDAGHGSHTASTVAGNFVKNVNLFGLGKGTTAGMAPHAHLAVYKVCDRDGCSLHDILAGLDTAVSDGVDIVSLSLGDASVHYDEDPIAIGAFAATQKGITVVCAGGNDGPGSSTLSNAAPWVLTVAASSVDRQFRSTVKLGNGKEYNGETLYHPVNFSSQSFPLFFSTGNCSVFFESVKGKIVLCEPGWDDSVRESEAIKAAGGIGILALNDFIEGYTILPSDLKLPGSILSYADGEKIKAYFRSTKTPTASISFHRTVLGASPAPVVASFSSMGPSRQSPGILKPDVMAPGLNIIGAWNSKVDKQPGKTPFNITSGTSVSASHVSGIAALIKSVHPDWSPAAIRSAIITSSDIVDRDGNRFVDGHRQNASFFLTGAGHVNPSKATEPGLVYDIAVEDYIAYLCGVYGDDGDVSVIAHSNISCKDIKQIKDFELNYPSITLPASSKGLTVKRTVTNVGDAAAKYTVEVDVPNGVTVTVKPDTLQFSKVNEKKTFSVTVTASGFAEGNLKWVSGKTLVRSALVITSLPHPPVTTP